MTYFSTADLNLIRSDPSRVTAAYEKYSADFVRRAGLGSAPEGIRVAAFCSVVAYEMKPYGASPALSYNELIASEYLSCAQYVRLTMWLTEEFGRPDITYNAVGWDYGNAIPNHSQLFVYSAGQSLLLDPTIGLIVRGANLPNVAYGVGYGPEKFASFYDGSRAAGANLDHFNAAVQNAIAAGAYKHQYGIRDASSPDEFASRGMIIGTGRSGSHHDDKFIWAGTAWGGRGNDNILGRDGNDIFYGGEGSDRLSGGAGKDTLRGDSGNDLLIGGPGNDLLYGGDGNDVIVGGLGRDVMYGGGGRDRFRFEGVNDSLPASPDVIRDFKAGLDKIDLSRVDANVREGDDQGFVFIGSSAFSGHAGELRFSEGAVYGDVNGDGVADFTIRVFGASHLAPGDFIL